MRRFFTNTFLLYFVLMCFIVIPNTAFGAVKTSQGYFISCSTTNCTDTITTGFKPSAVIFYWTRQSTFGFATNADIGWGWAASTTAASPVDRAVTVSSVDANNNSSNAKFGTETYSIAIINNTTLQREATTTFTNTGFSVGWLTPGATTANIIHYLAIGGADITATDAGTFTLTTGTGSLSYTSLSFQPDFIMFGWTFTQAFDSATADMQIGLGMGTTSGAVGSINNSATNNVAANTNKRWSASTTAIIMTMTAATAPLLDSSAYLTSLDANGFTVNKVKGPAANVPIFFLAIKGGKHAVASLDRPTSAQSQATTSAGFLPRSLFLMSTMASGTDATRGNITSFGGLALGSGTTTASSTSIWAQNFNVDPSDDNMHASSSIIALELNRSTTVIANASLTSLDATGFTLNWKQVTSTNATRWFSWAIGDKATLPILTTDSATNVGNSSVLLNGTLSDDYSVTARGFAWGTNSNLLGGDTSTTTESGTFAAGSFNQSLSNLKSNVTYYFRAYATNSAGTSYGSIGSFNTTIDNTVARTMRLFMGSKFKIRKGATVKLNQR